MSVQRAANCISYNIQQFKEIDVHIFYSTFNNRYTGGNIKFGEV